MIYIMPTLSFTKTTEVFMGIRPPLPLLAIMI